MQRIRLEAPGYAFTAGQYLEVVHPDGTRIPLSIASAPPRLPELELHYRSTPGNPEARAMDELLVGSTLPISAAAGAVLCPPPARPLLVIAGGSGAAQAFGLCEQRAAEQAGTSVVWCVDRAEDLYAVERLERLAGELHLLVDDRRTAENEALIWLRQHAGRFRDTDVVVSGSPAFVYLVTDILLAAGVDEARMQSDVYQYAPP